MTVLYFEDLAAGQSCGSSNCPLLFDHRETECREPSHSSETLGGPATPSIDGDRRDRILHDKRPVRSHIAANRLVSMEWVWKPTCSVEN